MIRDRLQTAGIRLLETLGTIIIVLIFFGIFASILSKLFIPGTSLRQLLQKSGETYLADSTDSDRDAMLDAGGRSGSLSDAFRSRATLSQTRNQVKSKRADSIAWNSATPGMPLYNRDSVQTFRDSTAQISLDKKNSFTVGSNSLVIIRRVEKDLFRNERHSSMVVLEGELKGKVGPGNNPLNLEVTTGSAVARLNAASSSGKNTDFKITSNKDQSSSIVVYNGQAEVIAQGKVVTIPANTGITVKPGEFPGELVRLPDAPVQLAPADRTVLFYRELSPRVRFSWTTVPGTETYRFQLARDPAFKMIVIDKKTPVAEFVHGNLKKGVYYWKVSSIKEGCEGRSSDTRHVEFIQDTVPPSLEVRFPQGTVFSDRFLLDGKTEPGANLFVSGQQVKVSETGTFSHEVNIKQGINMITLEAVDAAGNVAYRTQSIQGGFNQ